MSIIKLTLQCLFTPTLYKVYRASPEESVYKPHKLEKWGNNVIVSALTFWNLRLYVSPLICVYIYMRGWLSPEHMPYLAKLTGVTGAIVVAFVIMRGVGRALNPKYQEFLQALRAPHSQRLQLLRQYDFEFGAFPTTYVAPARLPADDKSLSDERQHRSTGSNSLVHIIGIVAIRTFALRLIYPGTIGVIQAIISSELVRGRSELVVSEGGVRHKLRTTDRNDIDCMLVDRRAGRGRNAGTLVVCCEGNSGFYEIGVMSTPLAGGYSVLGWNHPGFAGSTGLPYPKQEQNAMDAVMQFAIQELGFSVENIVLFGWSIGGYPAAWAAARYPRIRCLVLDATFDDLLPLALARMPPSWAPLVREVVRAHVDLNVAELLCDYPGPLRIVRRTDDEIICLRDGDLSTNCGNELLVRVMLHRHPRLMSREQEDVLRQLLAFHEPTKSHLYLSVMREGQPAKETILTALGYMKDYRSSHCSPLPVDLFTLPEK